MKPNVSENIKAVIWFLSLCAIRFFETTFLTDIDWNTKINEATVAFMYGKKFITSVARAKINPKRMKRNTVIAREKLKEMRARGRI